MNGTHRVTPDVAAASSAPVFPFSALLGQSELQQALLLAAIDPGIGGVLVSGPRGTAKSTAARALAELLPDGRFVTLPLNASEERLVGTLDIETVLRDGAVRFSPGLLAAAHRGVLYVDEVNLLPDALVDALLDAAASGINTVERDGVSHSHAARFVLIGTMNPEEGELRPQLTDRFGLMVALQNCFDPQMRQQIVKARLAFDTDPHAFRERQVRQQDDFVRRIRAAQAALPQLVFDDAVHQHVGTLCIGAQVDGMRADLVMLRAARALAALEAADAVTVAHVDRVAQSVLLHRQRNGDAPAQQHNAEPDRQKPQSGASGASGNTREEPASGESDWGYLPPEPVRTAHVKGVIPLTSKKR
ncbi:ATP-binding protein [Paraburkholderia rhizosphaerae]|uniref:Magnesium chelatase subunit I n=1 Tax=Paraburkholderia rhizosphaerae TaxID=480658 RepID=A0A4R8LTI9_9BURK|nr:AAA family ATPase [Paraburkholderia rhizosphaerae]TDY50828.1 magnesium chelatase subunit I [Paraburkholderia rhizosphaerae]